MLCKHERPDGESRRGVLDMGDTGLEPVTSRM